jgi:beta-alanine--pyruvate transaminase
MSGPEGAIELFHGYTYSGHPTACAAALASLAIYRDEDLFRRVRELAPYWEAALHSLKDLPHVIDVRNYGLVGAIEYAPVAGRPGARGFDVFLKAFEAGLLVRGAGDLTALSPPLIISRAQIDELVDRLAGAIKASAAGLL